MKMIGCVINQCSGNNETIKLLLKQSTENLNKPLTYLGFANRNYLFILLFFKDPCNYVRTKGPCQHIYVSLQNIKAKHSYCESTRCRLAAIIQQPRSLLSETLDFDLNDPGFDSLWRGCWIYVHDYPVHTWLMLEWHVLVVGLRWSCFFFECLCFLEQFILWTFTEQHMKDQRFPCLAFIFCQSRMQLDNLILTR